MIVSATQIKLNGIVGFFRFVFSLRRIQKQLNQTGGVIFVKFKGPRTLTGWDSREAMQGFRNSGQHLEAMRDMAKMGQTKSVSWETDVEPEWSEAIERLDAKDFR